MWGRGQTVGLVSCSEELAVAAVTVERRKMDSVLVVVGVEAAEMAARTAVVAMEEEHGLVAVVIELEEVAAGFALVAPRLNSWSNLMASIH